MSKVITFSRFFPAHHPKKGQPTFFVEKIFKSLYLMKAVPQELAASFNFNIMNDENEPEKNHTIRAGNRWKVGDKFSPRVWSGKPYQSKQIIIAPDIEIKKIFPFEIKLYHDGYWIDFAENRVPIEYTADLWLLAKNDGLSVTDMIDWFINPKKRYNMMEGQIICWNENVFY